MPAIVLSILCFLLLAAHFLRAGNLPLVAAAVAAPLLLLVRRRAAVRIIQVLLVIAALLWLRAAWDLWQVRIAKRLPAARGAGILVAVAAVNFLAAGLLGARSVKRLYP